MKTILSALLILFSSTKLLSQASVRENLQFNNTFHIAVNAGLGEVLGQGQRSAMIPISNLSLGYHFTDRVSVLAETILYHAAFNQTASEQKLANPYANTISYGLALRFLGRKYPYCPTPFIQSGVYLLNKEHQNTANWLLSPGFLFALDGKDQLFMQIIGDIQALELLEGKPFLMSAKLGLSYYF